MYRFCKSAARALFVKEIEEALLSGSIDLAVHSMKDVPGETPDGLIFAAILPRGRRARYSGVARQHQNGIYAQRGENRHRIASPRCADSGNAARREIVPLRGNIDTRLKKIETENLTGVILAAAGMKRLGYVQKIAQYLPIELMLPAVGQGALGLQIRKTDSELAKVLAKLNHAPTAAEVTAERSYLRALGGGCRLPIAAYG